MTEPRVLYRAVSLPEFVDVFRTGRIVGGSNEFNEFDRRRVVFFGGEVTSGLIYQGEELDRQAVWAMRNDLLHEKNRELQQAVRDLGEAPEGRAYTGWYRKKLKIEASRKKFREQYLAKAQKLMQQIRARQAKLPVSSMILVTQPLIGGQVFVGKEGGMGDEPEYAFAPGHIGVQHLQGALPVKNRQIIGAMLSVPEARALAAELASKLW